MKRFRTKTAWSRSGFSSIRARVKLAAVGMPLGREASRISRLIKCVMILSSVNRSSELILSPHCFTVAGIAVADRPLVGVILAPDGREFLHSETELLEFLDRRFSDCVGGVHGDNGVVFFLPSLAELGSW
jgi:hypothetical protein